MKILSLDQKLGLLSKEVLEKPKTLSMDLQV